MDISVFKIGGECIDNPAILDAFIADFVALNKPKVLVHGGGKKATEIAARLGIETQMVEGRRITSPEMLEVTVMTYAGLLNKQLVARLNAKGQPAVGICGADAGIVQAHKRPVKTIDYGMVGDITGVDVSFIYNCLKNLRVLVIAPISADSKGQLLNINADTVATEIAIGLAKYQYPNMVSLHYCFDKPGLLAEVNNSGSLITHIQVPEVEALKEKGTISGGMIPKIDNAVYALRGGLAKVWLGPASDINSQGTTLSA